VTNKIHAAQVSITWDPPNPGNSVVGYKVYYGSESRAYSSSIDVGNLTTCIVDGLSPTQTYYFAITAYNNSSNESDYSSELVWDNIPPTISGPDEINLGPQSSLPMVMPDLRRHITITDDFSPGSNVMISQKPGAGATLVNVPSWIIFTAMDEAGNRAGLIVSATDKTEDPRCNDRPLTPKVAISMEDGQPIVRYAVTGTTDISSTNRQNTVTLEWCTNLCTSEWHPIPGYENMPVTNKTSTYRFTNRVQTSFFRIRTRLE